MSDTTSDIGHLGYSGEDSGAVASAGPSVASQMSDPGDDTSSTANNVDDSPSAVAKALSFMLSSVIRDFDSRAEDTVRSQDQVSFDIDRLTGELDRLLEDAPLPFLMQHAARISGVRRRVSSLNVLLKSIQRRLDNVDQVLFVGLPHEKAAVESARQH